jgi:prevent-host-death family protein
MTIINMHQAKTELSDLVARAEAGEEIVIARRNKPAVKLVPVEVPDKAPARSGVRRLELPAHMRAALAPLADVDWFEHAPDEYISKEDIAAYYRKYPAVWGEMREMVGLSKDQAAMDLTGLSEAVETGKEFTIMQGGKPVAQVVPVSEKKARVPGRFAHLRGNLPPDLFDQPLSDDELDAWEGKYSSDGSK